MLHRVLLLAVVALAFAGLAVEATQRLEKVDPACPQLARYQVRLCKRLLKTLLQEGSFKTQIGHGEEVCTLQRFSYEDMRTCANVYNHIAEVGKRWDLDAQSKKESRTEFCVHVLAEPVRAIALLSPRTERKCLGTKTAEDDKFDMEPVAPEGYTGNVMEDGDSFYINGCLCRCDDLEKCCSCAKKGHVKSRKAAHIVIPKSPKHKDRKPAPPKPLPAPSACTAKTNFPYHFPYSQYTPTKEEVYIVADIELQRMRVYQNDKLIKSYKMSSSELGTGFKSGSFRSPTGKLRIRSVLGEGLKEGTDFVGGVATSKSSGPNAKAAEQSRVLLLEGEDKDNANTASRQLKIHGTNKVSTLGHPASQGCFRLSNKNVIDLASRVKPGTRFFVIPKCAWPRKHVSKAKRAKNAKRGKKLVKQLKAKKAAKKKASRFVKFVTKAAKKAERLMSKKPSFIESAESSTVEPMPIGQRN